jgi:lysophospholipase L1-like esterase
MADDQPLASDVLDRSILRQGNLARLGWVLARAARGEPITLGAIGGSITHTAAASKPRFRYVNRVAAWIERRFPGCRVRIVNAGRGATGSNYGALRADRDLLGQKPDLVICDWAVNDGAGEEFGESLEGIVRRALALPSQPPVVLIMFSRKDGTNVQDRLATVGTHYDLPMVSYRDAMWAEIRGGRLTWDDISPDEVHPNDRGHDHAAAMLAHLFERAVGVDEPIATTLPPPLYSDRFTRVTLHEAPVAVPLASAGWAMEAHSGPWASWVAHEAGAWIEFELVGETLLLMIFRLRGDTGVLRVRVDGGAWQTFDTWFPGTWGSYRETVTIASGLPRGPHRVRIEVAAERNAESGGHECRILGLGAAGV